MANNFRNVIILLWMSLSMIFGFILFTNGFFLRRSALEIRSNCTGESDYILNDIQGVCFSSKTRVVILLIDALKYEFIQKFDDLESQRTYHRNKIPIIHEHLVKEPKNARVFRFIADPPTTTMQRLKSLTTGTLPTFIDMQDNFAADAINEDNIITQNQPNGNIILGDDTWNKLYPNQFLREFSAPSFQVSDLDTVDQKVRKHIFQEIEKADWSLLIGHVLGIDHCGHKHGMHHLEMTRKLNETNILIKEVIEKVKLESQDTVLFVIGDHGMTESGDHGGDSSDEIEAAMFVYSTKPLIDTQFLLKFEPKTTVNQVDIVPTISTILGIPIPFSNIGHLIIESLPTLESQDKSDFNFILQSLYRNIYQIHNYVNTYSSKDYLAEEKKLEIIQSLYQDFVLKYNSVKTSLDLKELTDLSFKYSKTVRNICYDLWVQFDSNSMSRGLIIISISLFSFFLLLNGFDERQVQLILDSYSLLNPLVLAVVSSIKITSIMYWLNQIESIQDITLLLGSMVPIMSLCFVITQHLSILIDNWCNYYISNKKIDLSNFLTRIILLITVFGVFSNSFIIGEDKILLFFLTTLFIYLIYFSKPKINDEYIEKKARTFKLDKRIFLHFVSPICICFLIRFSSSFWRLREEQRESVNYMADNSNFIVGKTGSITSRNTELCLVFFAILSLASYVSIIKLWLRNCGNLCGYTFTVLIARIVPEIIVIIISSYWILKLQETSKIITALLQQINCIPLIVYTIFLIAMIILFWNPLTVFKLPQEKQKINITENIDSIPKLYKNVKNLIYEKKKVQEEELPIVYGFGTVYSASYIVLSVFICLIYGMLLGFVIVPSVILMCIIYTGLLYISSVSRLQKSSSFEELIRVSNAEIFCWFLLAEYFFFATGHQNTFSTIHWDAAFIGFDSTKQMNFLRAMLIGFNTFGSYLFSGISLPLLIIAPIPLKMMFSTFCKRSKCDEDLKRGELVLFERNTTFHGQILFICGKYILFHGFRVFACMLAATIHCRHLMVWKIFAPKLIFEGLSFFVTVSSVIISYLFLIRMEYKIEAFITQVTKER